MAVPTGRSDDISFPRPLPHPSFFVWATWLAACGFAYWTYYRAARGAVSIVLSIGFWALTLVVIPAVVHRGRERMASVITALLALLACAMLMLDALK
jgi:hypothetical protein